MNKLIRGMGILLAVLILTGLGNGARADVATIGVSFTGRTELEDGTWSEKELEGSFRLIQNGEIVADLRAWQDTVTVTGTERLRLEPLMETMPLGWDLSTARVDEVRVQSGKTTLVPITVYAAKEPPKAAEIPTEAPTAAPQPADPEEGSETGEETWAEDETAEIPADEETGSAVSVNVSAQAGVGEPILLVLPTAVPAAVPTPEPAIPSAVSGDARLRVRVFNDRNSNGEQGTYEDGVSGVRLYLLDAATGNAVATAETDGTGEAVLGAVPAGDYRLKAWLPESWAFSEMGDATGLPFSCMGTSVEASAESGVISLRAGETAERGIGAARMIHVAGFCWLDEDGNGIYKKGETLLAGVRVTLEGQKNGLLYESYSGEDGSWYIDRVKPGFYTITAYAPEGMTFTRYSKTGGSNRSIFTAEGSVKASKTLDTNDKNPRDNQNIGFTAASEISGMCFLDANYNGLYDEGEAPLKGVKVTAIRQLQDDEIAVTYSDENGRYKLAGLRGNTYRVRAVLPDDGADFTRVVQDLKGNHFQARVGRRENFWNNFALGDGERRTVNVGAIYPGAISGTVYFDDDLSSALSGKEKIVSGFLVSAVNAAGEVVASDKTNVKGRFELTGLTPGEYSLKATAVKDYAFTRLGEGNVMLNLSEGEGYTEPFFLALGENRTGMDMGMIRPGRVEGQVFADRNDNGVQDAGENGLEGVVVRLMDEDGTEAFRTEIGADSLYVFDAVMPGRYRIEYTLPEYAVFAERAAGGNAIAAESDSVAEGASEWFTVAAGAGVTAPVCGALTLGRMEGIAFRDADGSGEMSEGKPAAEGVRLTLTPERSDLAVVSVTTGPDGAFALTNLRPDRYVLSVSVPEGMVLSRTDALGLPLMPGKNEQQVELNVPMGAAWEGQALGVVKPAAISGVFWLDENNNGLFEEGEQTPAGYQVTLTDERSGKTYAVMTTDEQGRFGTDGLIPAVYTASFAPDEHTLPAGKGDSTFTELDGKLVMAGLQAGEGTSRDDLRLGIVRYTSMGGRVWIDRGSATEPLGGAVITLKAEDGSVMNSMATGEAGSFRFDGLMPGRYVLEAELPAGCVVVEPGDARLEGQLISVAAQVSGRHGASEPVELLMGQDQTQLDFGAVLPGRLGDFCWLDLNGDGLQNYNEPGLAGVRIELIRNGETVMETVSNVFGFYRFEEIYPAAYTLRATPPEEVKATRHGATPRMIGSVLLETEEASALSEELTVVSDRANYNADLGFACRREGVLPAGAGNAPRQDWTSWQGSEN